MRKDLDDRLCVTFPNLYKDRKGDTSKTLMPYGFCVGDGWFKIIWDLSEELEKISIESAGKFKAVQVKEKFGGLRFYTTFTNDKISNLIRKAEELAKKTCDKCGTLGSMINDNGYYHVTCGKHGK